MGAAILVVWAGLDGFVYCHRGQFWVGILPHSDWQIVVVDRFAFYFEYYFQCCLYANSIWLEKQLAGGGGYYFSFGNPDLGDDSDLAKYEMGGLCQYSVSIVGVFCDGVAVDDYLFE